MCFLPVSPLETTSTANMAEEVFTWDPNTLPYIISPASVTSFITTLLCAYVISPILWSRLLSSKYQALSRKNKNYLNSLLGATIHAVLVSLLTGYILASGELSNRVFSKSPLGFFTMQISLGYFVADFLVVLVDPDMRKDFGIVVHHIAGLNALSLGLFNHGKFMYFIVYRFIAEVSTPFVHMRWTLHLLDYPKHSFWYLFSSLGMILTFFLSRVLVIPWHWYVLVTVLATPLCVEVIPLFYRAWTCLSYLVLDVLNVFWFSKMVKGALKLWRTRTKVID